MPGESSRFFSGSAVWALVGLVGLGGAALAGAQTRASGSRTARPLITQQIDSRQVVVLKGNVRQDLTPARDLGPVEDGLPLRLYLVLRRSPEQQAELDNLLARQQQPSAAEYHQWLTPQQFGERFGAAERDIAKITNWLAGQGLEVHSVLNNASIIDFSATAGQVRTTFHTPLHYYSIRGGRYPANTQEPMIPAALEPVVAGIAGLVKIPHVANHTVPRQASYDAATHRWHEAAVAGETRPWPAYSDGSGNYNLTPQDSYTIYNVNKVFRAGNLAASANVAVIEESDIEYGTVNGTTNAASGGDVATFRSLFGVPGTLNMHVYHGYGTVTCNAPGIDPDGNGEEVEASLDAEWANALAPAANLIFMSCDQSPDNGIFSSMAALIDNNLADSMSLSYGESELNASSSDYTLLDTLYAQADAQGQSFFVSSGDSGSDVADQKSSYGIGTSGINVNAFGSPNVTVAGGTDFQDAYDNAEGGAPLSTYWGATNSATYGDALSYVPETAWNSSCANSLLAHYNGYAGADYCATGSQIYVVGGSGGFSTHYAVPAYQTGILGYTGSQRAQPDVSGFASDGLSGHLLVFCDSSQSASDCSSPSNFGTAGGTSFVAPYFAGMAGLLVNSTGSRQGLLNPALYALAKAQFTGSATSTACYANGQTSNIGVTTGLPAANCIFNDVTTSNNDVPCLLETTDCYVNGFNFFGILSTNANSLAVAYASTPGYDEVTGIGTINVYNLISNWNTAFSSTTVLGAQPAAISTSQSTTLTATVTSGTPVGYVDTPPALSGTVNFSAAGISSPIGTCTLGAISQGSGSCSVTVSGAALNTGANLITATFSGSGTYPASTSNNETVTVTVGGLSSSAKYLGYDTTNQGNWMGQYGADGYLIANKTSNAPAYTSVSLSGNNSYTWTTSTTDPRALQTAPSGRIASAYYAGGNFKINVNISDGGTHRVALYLLDWDSTARAETITISDAVSNAVLDAESFAGFHNGEYVSWNIQGNVNIEVTKTGGSNGVVAGIFFDPVRAAASANYSGVDITTQGKWTGFYGGDGELLANAANSVPAYAAVSVTGAGAYTWTASTSDPRALQTANGSLTQRAAAYYATNSFTLNVNLTDGNSHQLTLYLLDWDTSSRSETISLVDVYTNKVVDSESFANFHGGQYVSWNVQGHVLIQVTRTGGQNAVVSGLFFDPAASGAAASYVGLDTATQGSWTGHYGSSGYSIANDATNLSAFAAVKVSGDTAYTWASSTSDTRALQTASGSSTRIASTYYSGSSFAIDVNLTGGTTHKISLYLLDWDGSARAETIKIVNADNNTVLDTESYSGFHNGAWAAWNVKGHVVIEVTRTGGSNAVVSGIFVD